MTEAFGAFAGPFLPGWESLAPGVQAAIWGAIAVGGVIALISVYGLVVVWVERKVSAFIQARLGPMHVGPHGTLQTLADGIKLLAKEDTIPDGADRMLFRSAPYVIFTAALAAWACVPFAAWLVPAAMHVGLLYVIAVSSVATFGIILAGWSSNNKWSLYGAFRSASQIVSYEVPLGMSLLAVVVAAGSLDLREIVARQEGGVWMWHAVRNPFLLVSFVTFFVSALAETNRTPFDLPEAESELVAGFHTEFSGMRFSLFFLAEYASMLLVSMIGAACFLGGWDGGLPWPTPALLQPVVILTKAAALVLLMIWLRWTLPRFRVDQVMNLCWKGLIPVATVALFGAVIWA